MQRHFELTDKVIAKLASQHGSPLFIYSEQSFKKQARMLLDLELPYGLTVRYAVKANPHLEIIKIFDEMGLHFDASSGYEAELLLKHGVHGQKISLSSQEPPHNMDILTKQNVQLVATSMYQLELFIKAGIDSVGLRINPGTGSGHNNRVTTGGMNSSFGLWHEQLQEALLYAQNHKTKINRLHIHIGSGADPAVWATVMKTALDIVSSMPDVTHLDIGGGYKIARTSDEKEADMNEISAVFAQLLEGFYKRTGRKLHLEIEPGTWLVGHGGVLVSSVVDMVKTGKQGHTFLRLDTGMNDILRPTLYGAQHEMEIVGLEKNHADYVVVGHNCETGDILTPAIGDSEQLLPRRLNKTKIGDLLVIYDTGAYCASMAARGYNSYPNAKEIII